MIPQTIISRYHNLNGKRLTLAQLKAFHGDVQKAVDSHSHGGYAIALKGILDRSAKVLKTMIAEKLNVVEVEVEKIKLVRRAIEKVVKENELETDKTDYFLKYWKEAPKNKKTIVIKALWGNIESHLDAEKIRNRVAEKLLSKSKDKRYLPETFIETIYEVDPSLTNKIPRVWKKGQLVKDSKIVNTKKQINNSTLSGVAYKYKEVELGPYKKDFERLMSDSIVMVWGLPGHGKTTWLLKLAQYLAEQNLKVLYVAREEYGRSVFDIKLNEQKINHKNLCIRGQLNEADIKANEVVFLDSVTACDINHKSMEELYKKHPNKLWFLIIQSTKDGNFRGSNEWEHLVDVAGEIHNRKIILRKNRLDPNNSKKAEKLHTEDAILEAKKKATIREAVKSSNKTKNTKKEKL